MAILTASILAGPTYGLTGGTARQLAQGGREVKSGVYVIDTTQSDVRLQPRFTFTSSDYVMNADGSFNKAKRTAQAVRPKLLANGKYEMPTGEVYFKLHPEMTDAEILALKLDIVQAIMDTDFDNFWKSGARS